MRLYFIINKSYADAHDHPYYCTQFIEDSKNPFDHANRRLMMVSDQIIRCDDNSVKYLKNRFNGDLTCTIDTEEFTWIKLSSVEI